MEKLNKEKMNNALHEQSLSNMEDSIVKGLAVVTPEEMQDVAKYKLVYVYKHGILDKLGLELIFSYGVRNEMNDSKERIAYLEEAYSFMTKFKSNIEQKTGRKYSWNEFGNIIKRINEINTKQAKLEANNKYKKDSTKHKSMLLEFYLSTESDIYDHLQKQSNKQGYIKELIRKDIDNEKI